MMAATVAQPALCSGIQRRCPAPGACGRWAYVVHEMDSPAGDPVLYPFDRGVPRAGTGRLVTVHIVELGLRRIALKPSRDLGDLAIDLATQRAVVEAQVHGDADLLSPGQVDQVVQVGLFGEVLYR